MTRAPAGPPAGVSGGVPPLTGDAVTAPPADASGGSPPPPGEPVTAPSADASGGSPPPASEPVAAPVVVAAVRAALDDLVPAGAAIVLGLSGGPDSVALSCLVTAARSDLRVVAAHVRHGLRDDSDDVAAAGACARRLGLALRIVDVVVTAEGDGLEGAARRARYGALAELASVAGAAFVATGHTADDQAETVLLNLARGCGLRGLAGMPAARALAPGVILVRPLLGLRRDAVRAVAGAAGLPVARDPTNADLRGRRARARLELLPALARLTGEGGDPVAALARLADAARRDDDALSDSARRALDAAGGRWGPVSWIERARLDPLPEAVRRRVVRLLLGQAGGHDGPAGSSAAVTTVLSLPPGRAATLAGGLIATAGGGGLAVVAAAAPALPVTTVTDGLVLPALGIVVRRAPASPAEVPGAGTGAAVLPPWAPVTAAAGIGVPAGARLVVRARRPGDRIGTAAGTRTVAAAMIDARVPRCARGLVPVLADDDGPLWVPGVAVRAGVRGPDRVWLERL